MSNVRIALVFVLTAIILLACGSGAGFKPASEAQLDESLLCKKMAACSSDTTTEAWCLNEWIPEQKDRCIEMWFEYAKCIQNGDMCVSPVTGCEEISSAFEACKNVPGASLACFGTCATYADDACEFSNDDCYSACMAAMEPCMADSNHEVSFEHSTSCGIRNRSTACP